MGDSGKNLHFKGTTFHRIIPEFILQGGDITLGNGNGGEVRQLSEKVISHFDKNGLVNLPYP